MPRARTWRAWPRSDSSLRGCSTPSWRGGWPASTGSAWAPWSRTCSACGWRRATRLPTGRPGRCRTPGSCTPPLTSRCCWSCARRSRARCGRRASSSWRTRSSRPYAWPPLPRRGWTPGGAPPACTACATADSSPPSRRCGRPGTRWRGGGTPPPAASCRTPRSWPPCRRAPPRRPRSWSCRSSAGAPPAGTSTPGSQPWPRRRRSPTTSFRCPCPAATAHPLRTAGPSGTRSPPSGSDGRAPPCWRWPRNWACRSRTSCSPRPRAGWPGHRRPS